ncbi:hypothetical protein AB552B1_01856 [Acinetobacter baumannii]|nr:hypothetical protein AB552B1_01856 [Acinetobacter baumannii]
MAAKAKDGITFIGEIDGYPVIGQFTTVRFEENDQLIAVVNKKPVEGRHQIYAVLDPKSGLLYMIYEMGRSVKMGYKAIVMQTYYFTLICWGGISIMFLLFYIFDLISWVLLFLILAFLFMGFINYFAFRKSYENFGNLSEQIFEKLGFENPKEQDFYNDYLINDGINISVIDYRKNLKGKDPYPEDYFDKKNF